MRAVERYASQITLQPRDRGEESAMRSLAHGEELADLVEGNVEPLGELRDVVRQ